MKNTVLKGFVLALGAFLAFRAMTKPREPQYSSADMEILRKALVPNASDLIEPEAWSLLCAKVDSIKLGVGIANSADTIPVFGLYLSDSNLVLVFNEDPRHSIAENKSYEFSVIQSDSVFILEPDGIRPVKNCEVSSNPPTKQIPKKILPLITSVISFFLPEVSPRGDTSGKLIHS